MLVSGIGGGRDGRRMNGDNGRDLAALVDALGCALGAGGGRLGLAESCTGGWAAKAVTDRAGVSAWFWGGVVAYHPEAKTLLLGVPPALIAREGVVSEAVARAMAEGLLARVPRLTHAASVTGVAGPDGGSATTPVGTVCFAWAARGDATRTERRRFGGDREAVRRAAVRHLLAGILAGDGGGR